MNNLAKLIFYYQQINDDLTIYFKKFLILKENMILLNQILAFIREFIFM